MFSLTVLMETNELSRYPRECVLDNDVINCQITVIWWVSRWRMLTTLDLKSMQLSLSKGSNNRKVHVM